MARINLLPWREARRQELQRQFFMQLAMAAAFAVVVILGAKLYADGLIDNQRERNDLLKSEIRALDRQIQKINELEATRENLLARKEIIENLQGQRSQTVQLLQELVTTTPVGVTLGTIRQQDRLVTLAGTTQSNARVSAYLQELMASKLFLDPELEIVEAAAGRARDVEPYDFRIRVTLANPNEELADDELVTDDAVAGGAD